MADRPTLSLKTGKPARDPRRPRVRGGPPPKAAGPTAEAPGTDRVKRNERPERTERTERTERPSRPEAPQRAAAPRPPRPAKAPLTPPGPKPGARAAPRPVSKPTPAGAPRPKPGPKPGPKPFARATPPTTAAAAEGPRLNKLMTERGLASRREADDWIAAGWVRVDGAVAQLGQRVAPDAAIEIDERARHEQQQRVTVLLHKPMGWVSGQPEDGYEPAVALVTAANQWDGDRSGIRFHPGHLRHLAPAGRLDIDSTGLLVFTQDGRIARHLIGDETRVEKEYLVRVERVDGAPVQGTDLAPLRQGLELDGVKLRPAQASWQNEQQLRMVLREGRKRQIRRMCELVGLRVLALKRVRIGSVPLGPLPEGCWRYLRADERF
jgi:23S rRNA pseudouridine2604 synthase